MLSRQPKSISATVHNTEQSARIEKGRRKRLVGAFFGLLFLGSIFSGQQSVVGQTFNYADFSSTAGLQLNGNAAPTTIFPPIRLRMTDNSAGAGANQTSSVYYNTLVNVYGGFTTTFQFQVSSIHAGTNAGGEGIAFIIQNSPSGITAMGPGGADMGYATIPNSFVVELDMALNPGYDSNDNHISVHTLGTNPNSAVDLTASIAAVSFPTQLKDGAIHTVKITFDGAVGWDIYLDNLTTPVLGFNYAVGAATNSSKAYVGFTSATGSGNNVQTNDILNWSFSSLDPTAADGNIGGIVTDNSGAPIAGAVVTLNGAQKRKTITNSNGAYQFDNVETIGFYTVTPSRTNYSFSPASRSFSQLGNQTDAAFTGSTNGDTANPLDTPEYFVRQQYLDILGREPDEGGFNYWSDEIAKCAGDSACVDRRRREVAASFFIEQELQDTGSFVYGLYKASYGVRPTFAQYQPDRKRVVGGPTLTASRDALAADFVNRAAFKQAYPDTMTNEEFVNQLYDTAGLPFSMERTLAVNRMQNGATRAQILEGVIADAQFAGAEYNAAFVTTEYFAYLRRDPEPGGYDFWLNVLDHGDAGNFSGMVCSFITSTEYQKRFSAVVSHSNAECGR